jgi:hypothetical protein
MQLKNGEMCMKIIYIRLCMNFEYGENDRLSTCSFQLLEKKKKNLELKICK